MLLGFVTSPQPTGLGGGDKSTQPTDIAKAMRRAATLEE